MINHEFRDPVIGGCPLTPSVIQSPPDSLVRYCSISSCGTADTLAQVSSLFVQGDCRACVTHDVYGPIFGGSVRRMRPETLSLELRLSMTTTLCFTLGIHLESFLKLSHRPFKRRFSLRWSRRMDWLTFPGARSSTFHHFRHLPTKRYILRRRSRRGET